MARLILFAPLLLVAAEAFVLPTSSSYLRTRPQVHETTERPGGELEVVGAEPAPLQVPLANTWDRMPVLGLGTWKLEHKDHCVDAVFHSIEMGYRHLDCAPDYGNERLVGEGIRRAIKEGVIASREDIFVTSKLWNTYHAPEHVEEALSRTLDDLGLEYLDLYMIHFPIALEFIPFNLRYPPGWLNYPRGDLLSSDRTINFAKIPLAETWKAMEDLTQGGRVRNIGICNINSALLWDLLTYAKIPPAVVQIERHVYNQQNNLVRLCRENGIAVSAASPLGGAGYVEIGLASADTDNAMNDDVIKTIADNHRKTPAQVMLRWNLQTGCTVMPKSSKPGRLYENLHIFDFRLSRDEIKSIYQLDRKLFFNNPVKFMQGTGAFCPLFD